MVCTGLPEAMLIKSTTLTMTRMAPSRTALRGWWALVSAVQLVQRPADLNRAHPVFLSQSGQKFGGAADTEIKTWYLQLIPSLQGLNAGALAQSPQRWFGAMMFGETLVRQRLICLVSRSRCCQTREWALCFKRVMSLPHDSWGRQILCRSCLSFLTWFCRKKLS